MNLYFTLDYELFMGVNTGTPENCLINSTNELCKAVHPYGIKFIVFVDAAYLLRIFQFKSESRELQRHYFMVTEHIKSLEKDGHDIQMHFHPQWLYSSWDEQNQKWRMDLVHYKLSDMERDFAIASFREAKALLDSLLQVPTCAYRAGGFCIQTMNDYKTLFEENNIKFDSSVSRGHKVVSSKHQYDFTRFPKAQIYRFSDDVVKEDCNGPFVELSISSTRWTSLKLLRLTKKCRSSFKIGRKFADGEGIHDDINLFTHKIKKLLSFPYVTATIDNAESGLLSYVMDDLKKRGYEEMIIIGHPKFVTDGSLNNIVGFLGQIDENEQINSKTIKELI